MAPPGFRKQPCEAPPDTLGLNLVWEGCVVTFRPAEADSVQEMRLFGGIIARDGIYKFMGFGNDF